MTEYVNLLKPMTQEQMDQTPDMDFSQGEAALQIKMTYSKDKPRRGLMLSIYRIVVTEFGFQTNLPTNYNGLMHICQMERKNDKIAKHWAEIVIERSDEISAIALASENPDWNAIKALIQEKALASV